MAVLAVGGAMWAGPATAGAAVQTFHRFEAEATANYTVTEQCADGSTVTRLVTVIGGVEEETGDDPSEFATVLIRGFDCTGNFVNIRASGPAEFTFSPSLQQAGVTGTVATRDGQAVAVDVRWEGTGPLETSSSTTVFPGFTGHFRSAERDAVATGTVTLDGVTLVDGSTANASIETLEDTNISRDAGT
jgi:hypothetical protein